MKLIVQKFGGTSVRDDEGRSRALLHIRRALDEGYKPVVVVSAMGRAGEPYATDTLLGLVNGSYTNISKREQDLLMSCGETISAVVFSEMLNQHGIKATAFSGGEAGFVTTDDWTNAKIVEMRTDRLLRAFEDVDVVVVTGFQGRTIDGSVTTLGRGGSDTSASALGVALQASYIDIFTDVEGVMTADPRIVANAQTMDVVSYTDICNLAYQGAKVIHPRAVELAMHGNVPLRVRSTYSESTGTLVTNVGESGAHGVSDRVITGIAHTSDIAQIKVLAEDDAFLQLQQTVFQTMASLGISVDFINISPRGVVYTVKTSEVTRATAALIAAGYEPVVTEGCAKVAIVGAGIAGVPGITSRVVTALASKGIPILQSADSHTTIWVLVQADHMKDAVNALHEAFI
ncbi:MAG: aspartate kinase [Bacilli bacterium]